MDNTQTIANTKTKSYAIYAAHVILGSLFMAVISQMKVPLEPIPMTLQTLGVFLLAIAQGGKKASFSLLLYLLEATAGFPVLSGMSIDPFWIISPKGGYLVGFPIAAYVTGFLLEFRKERTWLMSTLAVLSGQLTIYFFGITWLLFFMDIQKALLVGVVPFLPTACYKLCLAVIAARIYGARS